MSTGLQIVLLIVLVAWTAFFVAAEYAFVAARPTRMRELAEQGSKRAARVVSIQENPTRFISSIQVAITFAGLAIGAVGEPAVRSLVGDALEPLGGALSTGLITVLSVIIGFAIIIAITVVLGEIVPKALTLARTEGVALVVVGPVRVFTAIVYPFVWLLERLSAVTLRLFGLRGDIHLGRGHTEEELRMILAASYEEGVLEAEESEMLDRVFDFADTEVRQVMVPRPDVVLIPITSTVAEAAALVDAHPYTRYPVYGDDHDDIRGVIHVRHLYGARVHGTDATDIAAFARPVPIVPETKKLDELMADFRRTKTHMAIVVDEYGGTVGIATLEDLLEEIVGEINDEFDRPDRDLIRLAPDRVRVEGGYPIEDFNERFAAGLPDEDYTSVGGFVFGELGRPARPGDVVTHNGYRFTVREVDGARIRVIDVELRPRDDVAAAPNGA